MISTNTTFQQTPNLPSTNIDGEIVLMNSETGSYYSLSGTAAAVWNEIGTGATAEAVCTSMTSRYEVDDVTCRRDVLGFLESLIGHKLIRAVE